MTTPLRSPSLRRRTTAASAALLLGLTLAACGGGDGDDAADDDPSPRASDTTSTSTTDTPEDPTSSATEDAPAGVPSEAELEAALLTVDDLPDGFTLTPDDGDDDESDNPFEGTCLADIGQFSDALSSEPAEEAEVEYGSETPTTQASVNAKISVYDNPTAIAPVFSTFTDQLQTCTSVQASADGVDYDFEIAYDDTVDVPGADDQLAFDVTGTIASGEQSYPASFRYVVALAGPFVSVIGIYALGDDTTGVLDTVKDLAVVQAERVAELG